MHKTNRTKTQLTMAEGRARSPKTQAPKKRANHKRRNWNRTLKLFALALFLAEAGVLLFANPSLRVTQVRVEGTRTLTPEQVFAEAQVPKRTNIFWMLRQPFARRLAQNPVIDHAERSIELPNRLVLTVTERQPRAVLAAHGQFWLLDGKGVPYSLLEKPLPHLPLLQAVGAALPDEVALGRRLNAPWLPESYALLNLLRTSPDLTGTKITVDQNWNLCLNRKDNLQIRLGQGDSLRQKLALAEAVVSSEGGALAQRAAYVDVSCPEQPVWMPRKDAGESGWKTN